MTTETLIIHGIAHAALQSDRVTGEWVTSQLVEHNVINTSFKINHAIDQLTDKKLVHRSGVWVVNSNGSIGRFTENGFQFTSVDTRNMFFALVAELYYPMT